MADFFSDLQEVLRELKREGRWPEGLKDEDCTWDDVVAWWEEARQAKQDREKGWRGFGRRTWTAAGDLAGHIDPWIKMVGDDAIGLSVLHGGLAVLLDVS